MRIGFNMLVLFALMRLWPAGGRGMDGADEAIIKMPYSDFVRCAKVNEVEMVTVDGLKVFFSLKPSSPLLQQRRQQAAAAAAALQQQHAAAASGAAAGAAGGSAAAAAAAAAEQRRGSGAAASTSAPSASSAPSATTTTTTAADGGQSSALQPQQQQHPLYFYTVRPADYAMPYEALETHAVPVSAIEHRENRLLTVLGYVLLVAVVLSTLNRLPNKQEVKAPGRRHKPTAPSFSPSGGSGGEGGAVSTTFADVAGVDEAKEELQEIVEYLRAPERFSRLGARPPAGVLLVGPPGTGKTLLAKAVAGEAGVPFFSISASEFVELYVGMGAMRVRELFAAARREAPAIVFIDEIDAVAKGRDMRLRSVGNDEREQTLNQLLTELDGFESGPDKSSGGAQGGVAGLLGGGGGDGERHPAHGVVICLAATNRPDVLDPALLRPGRFDRRVAVERPDKVGREQILRVHLQRRGLPLADDVSVGALAALTTGFTGADLANLVNEAALLGGRRGKVAVGREEFDAAVMRAIAGIEKKRSILQGTEKAVVARHEVGHALVGAAVSRLLEGFGEPSRLSIIPRTGGALGFTYTQPKTEDRALMFDSEIRGQLAVLMGGRAAEHLSCGAVSTGASDDIRRATDLATRAVSEFGLSRILGPINVGVLTSGGADGGDGLGVLKDGGDMGRLVEREVRELVEGALTCAMDVIATNRRQHDGLSAELLKDERVEGDALAAWFGGVAVPDSLREFVHEGRLPDREALGLGLLAPSSLLAEAGYGGGAGGAGGRADGGLSLIRGGGGGGAAGAGRRGGQGVVDVEVDRGDGPGAAAMLQTWQE
ncbi:hypothetical protein HYH02_008392 [Chlamydomonas schloesseri]|uniref:AAA+ ATPase domain-containing protein n=1 Tax=Chlamydomonas schloesseri TaxID=2026947 RepID=A0A835WG21_9CHLO|nr:hypothetical protein HYH02_008392 [Chlamydomonas schloesseri]|eukprot:KAG2446832.1 hypothetical protein HYH02_008392 [Chlamydomonas schloesseri]